MLNKNHAIREIAAKVHVSFDGKMVSLNKTRYSLSSVVRLNESLEK